MVTPGSARRLTLKSSTGCENPLSALSPRASMTTRSPIGNRKRFETTICPSPACRRAKACLACHDNLYCQRTHFSPPEQAKHQRRDPLRLELDSVMPVMDPTSLSERIERIAELAAIRRAHTARMTERWRAGEFDGLYGKYVAKGVVLTPPPNVYVEPARLSSAQTRVNALG